MLGLGNVNPITPSYTLSKPNYDCRCNRSVRLTIEQLQIHRGARRFRVRAALREAVERLFAPLVTAAFLAAADRSERFRRAAAFLVCLESASLDAASCSS